MTYDPSAETQQLHGIDVTITNTSTDINAVWDPATIVLKYSWFEPETAPVFATGLEQDGVTSSEPILLGPGLIRPGNSVQVRVPVEPPDLPPGTARVTYRLQFDLYDQLAGTFFAEKGNRPSANAVVVNNLLMTSALGLEHYYHYRAQEVKESLDGLRSRAGTLISATAIRLPFLEDSLWSKDRSTVQVFWRLLRSRS